ncbi:S41 family peptidase [Inhella gelatinilytica]|uniref:Tail specific protease domain-containing protein n=1 Tax=Inhella gelatinilytica TaxID=2795030 RepID=A0A931IX80_9BURK|nr:S41 family peptidase [Inhella gelatinilytica]MBH9551536.1 hypothetical protein [Inhella gelatinilytica]
MLSLLRTLLLCGSTLWAPEAHATPPDRWTGPLQAIDTLLRTHSHDPDRWTDDSQAAFKRSLERLAAQAPHRAAFVEGFNRLWATQGPFSHVQLLPQPGSAEAVAQHLDALNVGPSAVQLSWHGEVAVLAVHTLMGRDTQEAISAAYRAIVARPARALILDLRENPGGAFAVRPLVGHLIDQPLDTGVFLPRRTHSPPQAQALDAAPAWRGWSLQSFWTTVQTQPFTRIQFEPLAPHYAGPVAVLTSPRTASAAEMAVDALLRAQRVGVVGERTAGRMLTQKPFDVPGTDWVLMLPVADYHAWHSGRIEGQGIRPTLAVPAADALTVALTTLFPIPKP